MSAAQSAPSTSPARFNGTDSYVATDDLKLAVNAALTLQRPLPVSYTHLTLPTIYSV